MFKASVHADFIHVPCHPERIFREGSYEAIESAGPHTGISRIGFVQTNQALLPAPSAAMHSAW